MISFLGLFFSLAFQMRYDPCNIKMKQMCDEGALGKVGIVRRRHCLNLLFNESFFTGGTAWHIDPDQNMGMFMDDASHAADWFLWLLGKPKSVIAEIDNVVTDPVSLLCAASAVQSSQSFSLASFETDVILLSVADLSIRKVRQLPASILDTADSIRRECEASLRRLKLDAIDLYQVHWPDPDQDLEEGWRTLAALKDEGKVRYIGASNFSIAQMKRAQAIAPITSLQPPYSLLHREVEKEILPSAGESDASTAVGRRATAMAADPSLSQIW